MSVIVSLTGRAILGNNEGGARGGTPLDYARGKLLVL